VVVGALNSVEKDFQQANIFNEDDTFLSIFQTNLFSRWSINERALNDDGEVVVQHLRMLPTILNHMIPSFFLINLLSQHFSVYSKIA